jgi:GAF domain-containing protein/anti-sigma regulatory factor (Ser/Thr protein kinase)
MREWAFDAVPPSIRELRGEVTAFARGHGVEEEILAGIALAVSEAATNAVLHAFVDSEPGTVRMVAQTASGELVVRIVDDGRGMQPRSDSPGLGLGLPTIGRLTTSLDIREGASGAGTEICMTFAAPGVVGPPAAAITAGDGRLELLTEVARLAEGSGWPGESVERLADLLVPAIADVCAVDVADQGGTPRRLAAKVAGTDGAELSRWLLTREAPPDRPESPTRHAMRAAEPRVMEVTPELVAAWAHDEHDAQRILDLEMAWWMSVPLVEGRRVSGALGFGFRHDRPAPQADLLSFLEVVAERATRGLSNAKVIEELTLTRRRLERILAALAEAVTVNDADGRLVYANDAAARLLGAESVEELLAAKPGELAERFITVKADGSPLTNDDLPGRRVIAGLPAEPLLTRAVERSTGIERWQLIKATLLDDDAGLAVNIIEDVTEAKDAELRQRFLAEAGEVLASSLDYGETLQHVARLAVPVLGDWCTVDVLDADGSLQRLGLAHVDPDKLAYGQELHERYPPDLTAEVGLGAVLRGGPSELYSEIPPELIEKEAIDDEHLRIIRELGLRSAMVVPMRHGGRTIGAITFVSAESERAFQPADLEFAEDLARRAAVAVENARMYTELAGPQE